MQRQNSGRVHSLRRFEPADTESQQCVQMNDVRLKFFNQCVQLALRPEQESLTNTRRITPGRQALDS